MAEIIIKTQRLALRRWQPSDLELWMEHLNTALVTEHLGGVRTREAVAERFFAMSEEWDARGYSFLAAESLSSGMFLGACGLTTIIPSAATPVELRTATQIGWIFREKAWGQGYATEAARAAMAYAFEQSEIERVYAQTTDRNAPSRAIMEKLAMGRRMDLDYHDPHYPARDNPTIIYAIDSAGWRRHQEIK